MALRGRNVARRTLNVAWHTPTMVLRKVCQAIRRSPTLDFRHAYALVQFISINAALLGSPVDGVDFSRHVLSTEWKQLSGTAPCADRGLQHAALRDVTRGADVVTTRCRESTHARHALIVPRRFDTAPRPTRYVVAQPLPGQDRLAIRAAPRGTPRAAVASIGCEPLHSQPCGRRSVRCA